MTRISGVYQITNVITHRCYIGASVNVFQRWREHRSKLRRGIHANVALQSDWRVFHEDAFDFLILEHVEDQEMMHEVEERYIRQATTPYNANGRAGSGPRAGYRHTEEAKRKMSLAQKGKRKPIGFGTLVSTWRKGRSLSLAHRQAIGVALLGRPHPRRMKPSINEAYLG